MTTSVNLANATPLLQPRDPRFIAILAQGAASTQPSVSGPLAPDELALDKAALLGGRDTDETTRRNAAANLVKIWSNNPKIDMAAMETALIRLSTDPNTGHVVKLGARTLVEAFAEWNKERNPSSPSQRR